jgi:hypothetical protein
MSEIVQYNAAELAEALEQYGSLPVAVMTVNGENVESLPVKDLRLELVFSPSGASFIAITAYSGEAEEV